jgi:hypothetical protein
VSDKRRGRKPIVIDVPDVPADEAGPSDAESQAVARDSRFRRLIAEGREAFARGEGADAADVFRELGVTAEDDASREPDASGRRNGRSVSGKDSGARRDPGAAREGEPRRAGG